MPVCLFINHLSLSLPLECFQSRHPSARARQQPGTHRVKLIKSDRIVICITRMGRERDFWSRNYVPPASIYLDILFSPAKQFYMASITTDKSPKRSSARPPAVRPFVHYTVKKKGKKTKEEEAPRWLSRSICPSHKIIKKIVSTTVRHMILFIMRRAATVCVCTCNNNLKKGESPAQPSTKFQ